MPCPYENELRGDALAEDEAESDGFMMGTFGEEILRAALVAELGGVGTRPGTPARSAANWGGNDAASASASSTLLPVKLLSSCTTCPLAPLPSLTVDNPNGLDTLGVVPPDMLPSRLFLLFLSPSFIGGDPSVDDSSGGPSIVVIGLGSAKLIDGVLDLGTRGV